MPKRHCWPMICGVAWLAASAILLPACGGSAEVGGRGDGREPGDDSNGPEACLQAQGGYDAMRDQLLSAPGALRCARDADCKFLANFPYCGDECQGHLVGADSAAIEQRLSQFQTDHCSTCAPASNLCIGPPSPSCVGGICSGVLK